MDPSELIPDNPFHVMSQTGMGYRVNHPAIKTIKTGRGHFNGVNATEPKWGGV